jgi:hypothetical protein
MDRDHSEQILLRLKQLLRNYDLLNQSEIFTTNIHGEPVTFNLVKELAPLYSLHISRDWARIIQIVPIGLRLLGRSVDPSHIIVYLYNRRTLESTVKICTWENIQLEVDHIAEYCIQIYGLRIQNSPELSDGKPNYRVTIVHQKSAIVESIPMYTTDQMGKLYMLAIHSTGAECRKLVTFIGTKATDTFKT